MWPRGNPQVVIKFFLLLQIPCSLAYVPFDKNKIENFLTNQNFDYLDSAAINQNHDFPDFDPPNPKTRAVRSVDYTHEEYLKSCGETIRMKKHDSIQIMSMYHGTRQYPANSVCHWYFMGNVNDCIPTIHCPKIDLRSCDYDQLIIFDGWRGSRTFCEEHENGKGPLRPRPPAFDMFVTLSIGPSGHFSRFYKGIQCQVTCGEGQITAKKNGKQSVQFLPESSEMFSINYNCKCGLSGAVPRIVGGSDALPFEFPWMVALTKAGSRSPFCGGSLINSLFVVTAGHCVRKSADVVNFDVLIHAHILNNHDVTDGLEKSIRRQIVRVIKHPLFQRFDYDIALLQLNKPVDIQQYTPACLPSPKNQMDTEMGQRVTVTGWGKLKSHNGSSAAKTLQKVVVPLVGQETCRKATELNIITENMICAGAAEGGHDACQGDSGGPLMKSVGEVKWEFEGIVSFGFGCASPMKYGIYTRVSQMTSFIRRTAMEGTFCEQ